MKHLAHVRAQWRLRVLFLVTIVFIVIQGTGYVGPWMKIWPIWSLFCGIRFCFWVVIQTHSRLCSRQRIPSSLSHNSFPFAHLQRGLWGFSSTREIRNSLPSALGADTLFFCHIRIDTNLHTPPLFLFWQFWISNFKLHFPERTWDSFLNSKIYLTYEIGVYTNHTLWDDYPFTKVITIVSLNSGSSGVFNIQSDWQNFALSAAFPECIYVISMVHSIVAHDHLSGADWFWSNLIFE